MATISCENLEKRFGGALVLDRVSVEFPEVGAVAIVGPNGAGKTTLLNVITGYVRADSGSCKLAGREVSQLVPQSVARMGIIRTFQDARLIRELSVLENVLLACPNRCGESLLHALSGRRAAEEEGENRGVALESLAVVGLREYEAEAAGSLSYGQQKLLTLACCLATRARVLMLDEPVAGVDLVVAREIRRLLTELKQKGRLVVFIEHDLETVLQAADRIVFMDQGRVLADGSPAEVLARQAVLEAYVG